MNNVCIEAFERGKRVARRDVHNVWTTHGREYLAELIALSSMGPDVPERVAGVKYIGFGMGGSRQNQRAMVTGAPLSTVYPVGSTPHGSSFEFRADMYPSVQSLEMPVPADASSVADSYTNHSGISWRFVFAHASDVRSWAAHPHPLPNVFRYHFTARLGTPFVFTPPLSGNQYHLMPLSEAALFTNEAPDTGSPFSAPVAYVSFDTIQISELTDLYVTWDIVF